MTTDEMCEVIDRAKERIAALEAVLDGADIKSACAAIVGDRIVIQLPITNLDAALDGAWAAGHQEGRYRVTDPKVFAKEVARALNREREDGTTPIHLLFDECMYEAIDQGAEGVEEHPDQEA